MPTKDEPRGASGAESADGYGYDARVLPRKNVMLTSSFTGLKNYMRDVGSLMKDPEALKNVGGTMVLWDFPHTSAEEGLQGAGCTARDSLGLGPEAQLRIHRDRVRLQAVARLSR
jgi:selenium-binding protein 1